MLNQWKYWRAVEIIKRMPQHYQKYLNEMQHKQPQPVHYIPKPKLYTRDPVTGEEKRFENRPIPLLFPSECNNGLWGGEGIVQGFRSKRRGSYRCPHFWVPKLHRSVVYSEILDKHLALVVTRRALELIDKAYGFDFYILQTHPVDLRSQLAMDLRRKMILTLIRKEMYPNDPEMREKIYLKYKKFIIPEEEAEWLGLSLIEAVKKQLKIEAELNKPVPLKIQYRAEFIRQLTENQEKTEKESSSISENWLTKFKSLRRQNAEQS